MARRSQCSSAGDNPLDPNYLPPHYREEYRLAIDALVEEDLEGYYQFLQKADVVDFLSTPEIQYIQESVQVPEQGMHPEHRFPDIGGDGSSDTYWPVHSDLDAPGLDLGWPQMHSYIGPTEVTTLVNPPEPDMPSIKEQARRLIKNATQMIAIAMDIFTDVDILHDILNATMRNVAVYILLDERNAHHFMNMVNNCRVNLQSIQFLRVRTVPGIMYHCRSGKSFKGQMMNRFLLTDCRAVLCGNYSFMWSFEKLHRSMAHLFLGQFVSTFDEEFRILYAQSEPLMIDNMVAPMGDFSLSHKRQYPSERYPQSREQWKFLPLDSAHPEERARHSYEDRMDMDWRLMPLKRKGSLHGPADMYGRFPPQQSRLDPSFEQGPSRMPVMENPAFKRHSYAEGGHGKYSYPFAPQQGMPEPENQGRQVYRGQQPYPGPGKEADYSAYDKFWNQDYHLADQYSEPGFPQEMEPNDSFDPVLNYLSSTRNVDFDQGSEKLPPAADLPFSSPHPRRLKSGQPYACQTSPTPSNPTDQKQFIQESNPDRKDPMVKRGLRDWRISSYLSAYDNPEDEGMPLAPPNLPDAFEEPSNPIQQTMPGIDFSLPKIPNVREFKVPAIPRASQIPSYAKTTAREQPKNLPDEPTAEAAETKSTPTPSESSSTTEGEKKEEAEQNEPKIAVFHREDPFRRKYNPAVPRSSRLRSSLIFSSLDQQHTQDSKTAPGQQDEEGDKNEAEQTKQDFISQVLGQRRSTREPFEWSRYMKSATFDNSATDSTKPDDGKGKADDKDSSKDDNSNDTSEKLEVQESSKQPDVDQAKPSPSVPQSKPSEAELAKTDQPMQPPKPLLTTEAYLDMNDPDTRLRFFKEMAAKRKAAKAAEAEKSKKKAPMILPAEQKDDTTMKKEEPVSKETGEKMADTSTSESLSAKKASAEDAGKTVHTETCKSASLSSDASDKTNKEESQDKNDPNTSQSCKEEQTKVSTDPKKMELKNSRPEATSSEPPEEPKLLNPAVEKSSPSNIPTTTNAIPANVPSLAQGTDESEKPRLDSTSKESSLLTPCSVEVLPSSALDSKTQNPKSDQLETSISSPPLLPEQDTGSELSSSKPSVQSSSSDHIVPNSGSTLSSSILTSNAQETVPILQLVEQATQKSAAFSVSQTESESTRAHLDSAPQLTSSEILLAVDSTPVEFDISPDMCAAGSEPNISSLQSTTKIDSCAATPSEKDVPTSESNSVSQVVAEETEVLDSSKKVIVDSTPPSLSPSSHESCLPNVTDLESKSRSDQKEIVIPTPSPAGLLPEHSSAETSSPVPPGLTPNASKSETSESPQEATVLVTPPSELSLTGHVTPSPAEPGSCSSLTESVGSVLSPEAEKTSTLHSPSDTNRPPDQITGNSNDIRMCKSEETCLPTDPTSKVTTEPELPSKTPEIHPSEPPVPAENTNRDSQNEVSKEPEMPDPSDKQTDNTEATSEDNTTTTQELDCSEKTIDQVRQNNCTQQPEITSDEVMPPSPQSKQPKSGQSRYHSSTVNVLSSSNLRDDTKLLLEQISANSQSRIEVTKESPVTDDEKEDEADKNAKREKERGMRSLSRGQPKPSQEREKLLQRIQSMRKERKVYSRFEMAP